jgi:hypothetical protein
MADNEITIESITSTIETAEDLSTEQKTFLEEHKADLEPDVAEKYGIVQDPIIPPVAGGEQKTEEEKKAEADAAAAAAAAKAGKNDDTEPDPEDVKVIEKVVAKIVGPIKAKAEAQQIETDLQSEFGKHPEYKPYEKQIRAFVTHPNRIGFIQNGLPVSSVVIEAIAPYLQKIGAQKERDAAAAAASSQGGGNSVRPAGGGQIKDWGKATAEEVAAKKAEVLGRAGA